MQRWGRARRRSGGPVAGQQPGAPHAAQSAPDRHPHDAALVAGGVEAGEQLVERAAEVERERAHEVVGHVRGPGEGGHRAAGPPAEPAGPGAGEAGGSPTPLGACCDMKPNR